MKKDLKNVNITQFSDFLSQEDFKNLLYMNYNIDLLIIGPLEKTENEKEHFHVFISFCRKIGFENFKKIFNTCHIEQVYGSVKQNYDYCCKNGEPYFISFDIKDYLKKEEQKDNIERQLINDIFIEKLPLKVLIMKYPKYALYNIKAIRELIEIRDKGV